MDQGAAGEARGILSRLRGAVDHLLSQSLDTVEARGRAATRAQDMDVAALYRRYGDLVFGRCLNLLGNELDAREATQDVFLRLHRYRDRFRGDASPATYLFHITTTTCLNRRRTRRRRPEELVEEVAPLLTNDTLLEDGELRDLVEKLLARADDKTRAMVVYHYADGMTHAEIGELFGLSAAAVRKRIGKFRTSLDEDPPAWLHEVLP